MGFSQSFPQLFDNYRRGLAVMKIFVIGYFPAGLKQFPVPRIKPEYIPYVDAKRESKVRQVILGQLCQAGFMF